MTTTSISSRFRSLLPDARDALAFAIVVAAALCAAWSTMDRGFLGDDFAYVGRFHALPWSEWPHLFVSDWSGGIWGQSLGELRPFAALSFMLDARVWGVNPLGYHLTNFALYAAAAWLVALIVRELTNGRRWLGVAAGVLFTAQPAHAEALAWITGRVDLLGGVFFLAAFFAAMRFLHNPSRILWGVWSCVAFALGVFSKEFCLTLPIFVVLWFLVYHGDHARAKWKHLALLVGGYAIVFATYTICRNVAFGSSSHGPSLNILSADFLTRQIDYLGWFFPPLLDPVRMHRADLVAHAGPILATVLILMLVAFVGWFALARAATPAWRAALFFGLVWYLAATLPLAVATYFSPRHLYLATAGLCIAAAIIAVRMPLLRRFPTAAVLALGLYCSFSYGREVAHWRHAAKVSERVSAAVAEFAATAKANEVLLLDAPDVFEGAWTWSWASPFALQQPFTTRSPEWVIERPSVFFNPPVWQQQRQPARLHEASAGVLLFVDERGAVQRREISAAKLQAAATAHLTADLPWPASGTAWGSFIAELKQP